MDEAGRPAPTGAALAGDLASAFGIETAGSPDLSKVAQVVQARHGRSKLDAYLERRLANLEPDEDLIWLLGRTWKAIFTTNYDRVIQRAYELIPEPTQQPVTIASSTDVVPVDWRFEVPIFHLHGSLFEGDRKFALITQDDYARFKEHRSMLFDLLKISYATSPILYVGYSNADPNWNQVFGELRSEFEPNRPPPAFRVCPTPDPLDAAALETMGVTTLDGTLSRLVAALKVKLGELKVDPRSLEDLQRDVPQGLKAAFESSPAAVVRLLSNWEYVNDADFAAPPNVVAMLDGDRPNWGLVGQRLTFDRDLEEPLLDAALDFATTVSPGTKSVAVLGSAGSGVTTILMSLASRLVEERAGTVLYLKSDGNYLEGDVEFAASGLPQPLFLIIDNAADVGVALPASVQRLRQADANALFVVGDRLNEWRQRKLRLSPREFAVEPLSEKEITGLLRYLASNNALGVLEQLPDKAKREAIRQRHGKQLIVAMKEATRGQEFDAIIEDEFRSISSEIGRDIYALVSTFYRLRVAPRDLLVARILGIDTSQLYGLLNDELAGVVVTEGASRAGQGSSLRARHHVIADVIWNRALLRSEREHLVRTALRELNLHFSSDARAFEAFYRSDEVVDEIADVDERITFFESAVRKDPLSPFVRQHYARMLLRAQRLEAALRVIDEAIKLEDRTRSLHHTRGQILSEMVETAASLNIARRRRAQAEEAYRRVISLRRQDEYGYEGLARLYLQWAQRWAEGAESTEFIRRCEEVIDDGLADVRDTESLWIVSAEVANFLGDRPEIVESLRRAIGENPESRMARYLLGREYYESGFNSEAISVIEPMLATLRPTEFRSALVFALASHALGEPYERGISVMRLAGSLGLRDARFAATLGGMLYMDGRIDEAEEVFDRDHARGYPAYEYNRIYFTPAPAGVAAELTGTVQLIRTGYTFVRVVGFSDFFLHDSEFGSLVMRPGLRLRFQPAFSVRGAVATNASED